jgi:hypothetical protein
MMTLHVCPLRTAHRTAQSSSTPGKTYNAPGEIISCDGSSVLLKFFVVWIFEIFERKKESPTTTTRPHREVGEDLRECFWGNIILARGLSATYPLLCCGLV